VEKKEHDLLSIILFGLGLCIIALTMNFVVFRENRLAEGVSVLLWESADTFHFVLMIIGMMLIAGTLLLRRYILFFSKTAAVLGNFLIIMVFISLADSTRNLMLEAPAFSRISLGSGAWIMLLGGYVITASAAKSIKNPFQRVIFSYLFIPILLLLSSTGMFDKLSLIQELMAKKSRFIQEFLNHLKIAFSSVGFAAIIGIPMGIWAYRKKRAEKVIFYFVNTAQTIPSLALFGLLIAPLSLLSARFPLLRSIGIRGIGMTPALIALTLYALLPITKNITISLKSVDPAFIDAGKGMGLNRFQLLLMIEIPLAAPIILNGLRLAVVQAIGNTAVAALIGAGGLGFFIFQGLGQAAPDLILLGAIPVVLLAVFLDRFMLLGIHILTPKGVQLRNVSLEVPGD
jgi:osmoprotectant transport system permease protein